MNRAVAGRAALWSAVDVAGRHAVTLVVSVILARLLTPADFGAVAIATFFAAVSMALFQQSLSTAIVQRQGASDEEVSSIFWWNLILSAAAAATLIAFRSTIAGYFALPVLAPLIVAAALQIVLTSLGAVHLALLNRDLRFAAIAKGGIPATFVSGLVGVVLAWQGAGVWALAAQLIASAALSTAAYWLLSDWRPAAVLRARGLGEAVSFARWLGLSAGLEVLYTQGFALVLGKLYGPRDLGLYGHAANTQQVPANIISGVIARVALPMFAARRDDPVALRRGLLMANRMTMVICLPALVGLTLTADLTIRVLFGPQWDAAAPVLTILAWAGAFFPLQANNLQVLLASGRSDLFFRLEIAKKVVGVIAVVIGSFFGIIGLAWSQLAFAAIALLINSWFSGRNFRCGLGTQLFDLLGVLGATAIMAVCVYLVRMLTDLPPLAGLSAAVVVGVASYALAGIALRVPAFQEILGMVSHLRRQ